MNSTLMRTFSHDGSIYDTVLLDLLLAGLFSVLCTSLSLTSYRKLSFTRRRMWTRHVLRRR